MKDDALTTCPKEACQKKRWGKGKVQRAIGSGAGLIFKGSGFYITDYRSENYKAGAKSDKPSPAKESKSSSTKKSKKNDQEKFLIQSGRTIGIIRVSSRHALSPE